MLTFGCFFYGGELLKMAKTRQKSSAFDFKMPDIKSLIFGKQYGNGDSSATSLPGTRGLIPVKDVRDGIIITTDNRYIKVLEVLPVNFYLKSPMEQQNIIHYFINFLKIAPSNLQFLVQTGKAVIDPYCERMEEFYHSEENENCCDMIYENAALVNHLALNEAVTRRFFLVFQYEDKGGNFGKHNYDSILATLNEQTYNAAVYLDSCGLELVNYDN